MKVYELDESNNFIGEEVEIPPEEITILESSPFGEYIAHTKSGKRYATTMADYYKLRKHMYPFNKSVRMIDKSNFSMEQYKTDIQSAYDCGKASVAPCNDAISRQAVLDMMQMKMGGKELYKAVYDLPSVIPKQKTNVLDKIRAEISDFEEEVFHRPNTDYSDYAAIRHCLDIIDKYKAESEGKECSE